jgi:hypothetical protein
MAFAWAQEADLNEGRFRFPIIRTPHRHPHVQLVNWCFAEVMNPHLLGCFSCAELRAAEGWLPQYDQACWALLLVLVATASKLCFAKRYPQRYHNGCEGADTSDPVRDTTPINLPRAHPQSVPAPRAQARGHTPLRCGYMRSPLAPNGRVLESGTRSQGRRT